jgi:hypothetical protein
VDKRKVIFLDESGFNLHLRRQHGWSTIGTRANIVIPIQRGANVNLLAAINYEKLIHKQINLKNTNAAKFKEFLTDLFEILNNQEYEHCWIVMDNVRFHKTAEIQTFIESKGHLPVYLPPYSPMLNPIESLFSKVKNTVRVNVSLTSRDNLRKNE